MDKVVVLRKPVSDYRVCVTGRYVYECVLCIYMCIICVYRYICYYIQIEVCVCIYINFLKPYYRTTGCKHFLLF